MAEIPESKPSTTQSTLHVPSTAKSPAEHSEPSSVGKINPFLLAGKQKLSKVKNDTITMRLANHIIQDMRPFSQIDSQAFREMILECEPRYKFPSRNTFKENIIPKIYETVAQNVKKGLSGNTVAFTTDSWTSRATRSYVTITAHFVPENFEMCSKILQTRELEESHTGENIGEVLRNAATEWGCYVTGITTDNASNMKIAARTANISIHLGCFAHTLNLASNKAIEVKSVHKLLGKIRVLVTFFHKSTTAAAILREKQKQLQVPEHKLVIDIKTRWNSSYIMVERFLEQQVSIIAAMVDDKVKKMHSSKSKACTELLSPEEVQKLEAFLKTMAPMYHATLAMSEDQQPTVGVILPLLVKLKDHFTEVESDTTFVKEIKRAVLDNLKTRYTDENVVRFLEEAQALDPRFKHMTSETTWSRIQTRAVEMGEKFPVVKKEPLGTSETESVPTSATRPSTPELPTLPPTSSNETQTVKLEEGVTSPPRKKTALSYLFEDDVEVVKVEGPVPVHELAEKELCLYKAEPKLKANQNPLSYWKTSSDRMPLMSYLARNVLCVQASSVPSERVFSIAGDIVTPTRACLDSDTLDMLIFLKKNMSTKDLQEALRFN